jgi:hypothetical protein
MFFMPVIYLWDKADRMLLRHALPARFSQLHLSSPFLWIIFLDKGGCFLVRHSQPQSHHGRFDASFLLHWMLTFPECRMPEQLLSRKSIIQKSREALPADSVPAAPTCVASSCALVLRYDTAARSVAVCLRLGWWILLFGSCLLHACNSVRLLVRVLA